MNTIARIIFDKLASGGGINLPDIGSLLVERDAARFVSKKELRPPHNRIIFSRHQNASLETVTEIMARTEGVDAEDIAGQYAAWVDEVRGEKGFVEIHGVGVIKNGFFYPSVELNDILNPMGDKNIMLRKYVRKGRLMATAAGILVVAAAIILVCILFSGGKRDELRSRKTGKPVIEKTSTDPAAREMPNVAEEGTAADEKADPTTRKEETVQEPDVTEGAKKENLPANNKEAAAEKKAEAAIVTTPPVYHVVTGIFHSRENAEKCISEDPLKVGTSNYRIYPYRGGRFMVSVFESKDKAQADQMQKEFRARKKDVWVYTAK